MFASRHLPYQQTGFFTAIIRDYLDAAEDIRAFYSWPPTSEGIDKAIGSAGKSGTGRQVLVEVLSEQYEGIQVSEALRKNLGYLRADNCFTITTAHQPNLFTGPLYFIYKILHAIRIAEELNKKHDGYRFVPVYYMGSEDADAAELNHTWIDGKKLQWDTTQRGAVGRMKVDRQLVGLIGEMEGQLSVEPFGKEITELIRKCYRPGNTIQQSLFELLNELFGAYGLIVLIPDHAALKRLMIPVFEEDLFKPRAFEIVNQTSAKLSRHYNAQAHAREINLFYLKDDLRERIERSGDHFKVVNTDIRFTDEEMRKELEFHPERFSPNVILRGIFQETILPNIVFIGGGGELAYWMQYPDLFRHYKVPFPVLVLRNSFLIIEKKWKKKLSHLGIDVNDLFKDEHEIMNRIVESSSGNQVLLNGNFEKAEALYQAIGLQAEKVDPTLAKHVDAIKTRSLKTLRELEKKMLRAEKRKFADQQKQVHTVKQALFPGNGLQERTENFSRFYARFGSRFIEELYRHSLSLEQLFTILTEEA